MNSYPKYIKVSNKEVKDTWVEKNPNAISTLKEIGKQLSTLDTSLYIIGSAAGREVHTKVNDVDPIVFVGSVSDLIKVEKILRDVTTIEGIEPKIKFVFELKDTINNYTGSSIYNPDFYTVNKVNNFHLGGTDLINLSPWLDEKIVKQDCLNKLEEFALMVFRIVNKQKWTQEQNSRLIREVRGIMFSTMHYLGYYGFPKTELLEKFTELFNDVNLTPIKLQLEARDKGLEHFYTQEPKQLQENCLEFARDMLLKSKFLSSE